jgi:hypothetical protein
MRLPRTLCLLIAVPTLSACACFGKRSPPPMPPLDASLARLCEPVQMPASDYDAWLEWAVEHVAAYGQCAARHRLTVEAWNEQRGVRQ